MKPAPVVARYAPGRSRATPARATRAVPALSAEEVAFLDGISTSGNFTLEKVLKRHEGVTSLRNAS